MTIPQNQNATRRQHRGRREGHVDERQYALAGHGLDHAPFLVDWHGDRALGRDRDARHAAGNLRSALREAALLTLFLLLAWLPRSSPARPQIHRLAPGCYASPATPDRSVSAFTASLEAIPTPGAGHVPRFTMLLPDEGSTFDSKQSGSSIRDVSIPAPHSRSQMLDLAAVWLPWVWVAGFTTHLPLAGVRPAGSRAFAASEPKAGGSIMHRDLRVRLCPETMRITRPFDLAACDRLVTPVLVGSFAP